jgi:hypothetical protein
VINLQLNEEKNVTLTLTEKMTVKGAPVLFEFYNTTNNHREYFTSLDISPIPDSYNRYRMKAVKENPDRDNGEFIGLPVATWHYTAYQMEVQGDLNPENKIKILENGMVSIAVDPTQRAAFDPDIKTITYEND